MTGFSPKVRKVITERSGGLCEVCGMARAVQIHHRRPRGAGSSKRPETNLPANALHLCMSCHERAERYRIDARGHGRLVQQRENPAAVPVLYRHRWVFLDDLGGVTETEMEEA